VEELGFWQARAANQIGPEQYYPGVFPYYGIQPSLYGYGLWGMERSIRIILFHNVMDRMPAGGLERHDVL
jgi:hypothetical protein